MAEPEVRDPHVLCESALGFEEGFLDVSLEKICLVSDLGRLEALEKSQYSPVLLCVSLLGIVATEEAPTHCALKVLGILEERLRKRGLEARNERRLG